MFHTFEYYKDVNVDGISIRSRRGLKGNEEDGVFEVFDIIGRKDGTYHGKQGYWMTGMLFDVNKYSYKEAMLFWENINLPKFAEVLN